MGMAVEPSGAVSYFTYLGGSSFDIARSVAVDVTGIFTAGHTSSLDFVPGDVSTVDPSLATAPEWGIHSDAFLVQLADPPIIEIEKTASTDPATVGQPFDFYIDVGNSGSGAATVDSLSTPR